MSSPRPAGLRPFLRFCLAAYWPVCLYELLFGWGYLLNLGLTLGPASSATSPRTAFMLLGGLAFVLPLAVILLVYRVYPWAADWKPRAWILYLGWLPIVLVIGFVFAAALGGASQAVVEGVAAAPRARTFVYLTAAVQTAVIAHVFIIPMVLIAARSLSQAGPQGDLSQG